MASVLEKGLVVKPFDDTGGHFVSALVNNPG
jgi:hypothetical protein